MTKKSKTTDEVVKETIAKVEEQPKEAVQKAPEVEVIEEKVEKTERKAKVRGKKYQNAKKLIDINKYYPIKDAVKLVKETSLSKFVGKIEAHINTFDIGNVGTNFFNWL